MAGNLSNFLEGKLVDHLFQPLDGSKSYRPSALHMGLSTANPGESGSGLAEPSGGSYARVNVSANLFWDLAAAGATTNASDVNFPAATGSWGTVTHAFIADAGTGGNILWYGPLTTPKTIGSGDSVSFVAGSLALSLD